MTGSSVCELIVVRHGETEWNAVGRQQGHLDSPLSTAGVRQGRAIAAALSKREFAALYSSDLARAFHTAEFIAAACGKRIISEPRLRERHLGVFQGLIMAEVEERYPAEYADFRSGDPDYVIPGGESARQRYDRTVGCAEEIAARHSGETAVIVAHGGILDGLFRRTLDIPLSAPRRFKLWNASINTFLVENGAWKLGTWGDIGHLAGIGTQDDR